MTEISEHPELEGLGTYEYGWHDKSDAGASCQAAARPKRSSATSVQRRTNPSGCSKCVSRV